MLVGTCVVETDQQLVSQGVHSS